MTELLLIIIGIFLLFMLFIALKDGALNPLFLFLVFCFIGVWVRAIQLVSETGYELVLAPWVLERQLTNSVNESLVELFIAIVIVFLSYYICIDKKVFRGRVNIFRRLQSEILSKKQSYVLVVIGSSTFFVFIGLMSYFVGGLSEAINALQSREVSILAGRGYVAILSDVSIVATLLLAFNYFRTKDSKNRSTDSGTVFLIMSIFSLFILIIMGGRGAFLQFLFMIGIIYYTCKGYRVKVSWLFVWVIIVSICIITVGLASRNSAQTKQPLNKSLLEVSENIVTTLSAPFALIDHYMLAKVYAEERGFDYGAQYTSYVLRPIPRGLWNEKPIPLALKMRQEFWGDIRGGIPPTIFGEFYISYGLFGLYFGCVVFGVALGYTGRLFKSSFRDTRQSVLYALLVVTVVFSTVRSGLEISFVKIIIYMVILASLNLILKIRI